MAVIGAGQSGLATAQALRQRGIKPVVLEASDRAAGLAFVGLEWQRSLSSNSLRGVGRDAARLARRLAAHLAGT